MTSAEQPGQGDQEAKASPSATATGDLRECSAEVRGKRRLGAGHHLDPFALPGSCLLAAPEAPQEAGMGRQRQRRGRGRNGGVELVRPHKRFAEAGAELRPVRGCRRPFQRIAAGLHRAAKLLGQTCARALPS